MKDRDRTGRARRSLALAVCPSAATLTTVRSTRGIASNTFSRNRLPGVTSVTFWRERRGKIAQAVLSAGRASIRSMWARSRPPSPEVFSKTWTVRSPRRQRQRHDVDRVVVEVELEPKRGGLVRRVEDLDQDLVTDRVEQAAPGLEPGDPHVAGLRAQLDQLDVLLASQLGRSFETAVRQHDDRAQLFRAGEQATRQGHGMVDAGRSVTSLDRFEGRS